MVMCAMRCVWLLAWRRAWAVCRAVGRRASASVGPFGPSSFVVSVPLVCQAGCSGRTGGCGVRAATGLRAAARSAAFWASHAGPIHALSMRYGHAERQALVSGWPYSLSVVATSLCGLRCVGPTSTYVDGGTE